MTMATQRGKSLLCLLILVVAFLVPVLAQENCDSAEVVLGGGEEHTFTHKNVKTNWSEKTLFVKAESSFEGFSVIVQGLGGTEYTVWFPVEDEYFHDKDLWYQLLIFAQIKMNSTIIFGFETKTCRRECEREKGPQSLQQQSVVPRGASRWRQTFPMGNMLIMKTFSGKLPTCAKPPPTPLSTVSIVLIVLLVTLMRVIIFAIVKFFKNRAAPCKYCSLFFCLFRC